MRITRNLAITISDALTAKSKEAIDKLRKEIDVMAILEYNQFIPEEIIKVSITCPSWIEKTDTLSVKYRFDGNQCYHRSHTDKDKRVIIMKAGYAELKVNYSSPIRRRIIKLRELEDNYRQLKRQTIQALIDLGSSKRIIEQFPDTATLFKAQPKYTSAPVQKANISGLKSKLQKQ